MRIKTVLKGGRAWDVPAIKQFLNSDDSGVCRAVLLIYDRQTRDEQSTSHTKEHNGIGFTAFDAAFLSGMAKLLQEGKSLTPKQLTATRKAVLKYSQQLLNIMSEGRVNAAA